MEIRVEEGRLVENATPGATGMERRAFGEFVGPGGELASYAFGWATDAEPLAGWLTIGIGAGNPAGGTFHAAIHRHGEDGHAFTLVDDVFADVPQGGPDLSAEDARGHVDLEFVWAVADMVMQRDRRARWLLHWLHRTQAVSTPQIFALDEPILRVANPADGPWRLSGTTPAGADGRVGHLFHAVDEDPTLMDVLDLEHGQATVREHPGAPWTRTNDRPVPSDTPE